MSPPLVAMLVVLVEVPAASSMRPPLALSLSAQ
jgi:hypothetical protein